MKNKNKIFKSVSFIKVKQHSKHEKKTKRFSINDNDQSRTTDFVFIYEKKK